MDHTNKPTDEMAASTSHERRSGAAQQGASFGAFVASGIGPRIMFAPEGGAGGGDGGTGGAGGEGGGSGGGEGKGGGEGGAGGEQKLQRPDYIPENWWDADKGFKTEDFNALVAFKAEHDANRAQVPEKPDGYKPALPKSFKLPEGIQVPEGESLIDESDPRIAAAREFAHGKGMSQADFEELIAFGVNLDLNEQSSLKEAVTKQKELLGGKAEERIGAVKTWVAAKLPADQAEALTSMMFTAKQIEAFEALMRLNRGAVPGNPGAGRDSGKTELSDEEWGKMSASERINYARQNSKK
jgi:hypothetical protein